MNFINVLCWDKGIGMRKGECWKKTTFLIAVENKIWKKTSKKGKYVSLPKQKKRYRNQQHKTMVKQQQ